MREFAAVTTFSQKGYKQYGKKFLDTFLEHWDIDIWVYYEGTKPKGATRTKRVHWVDLDKDKDREAFLATDQAKESYNKTDYRFQAARFSHKVFALTDPKRLGKVKADWWIWLDADIVTHERVDKEFLRTVCPEGFDGSYLGRKDWDHSECGFVGYHGDPGREHLAALRCVYTTGDLFELYEQHHDSYVFDQIREGWWFNISEGIAGNHVFDDSVLGTRLTHNKGSRKAGVVQPKELMSEREAKDAAEAHASEMRVNDGQVGLLVKTKNCVPDENIQANVHYNVTLLDQWVPNCEAHDGTVIFCSGGPSMMDYIEDIKKLGRKRDHYVVCVKHAHDQLIEAGVVPWACMLLDPRSHVQDFVENPHKKVRYFVSSMVHPTTLDGLRKSNVALWGYHAHVGAGEDDVLRERLGEKTFMIGGGCSSAMRGISVLHCIGFRKFKLYGYDLNYPLTNGEVPKEWDGQLDGNGNPKYMEVEVMGKKFWTDAEKVAQAQDFIKMMDQVNDIRLETFGPGIVPHVWNSKRKMLPQFSDIF